MPLINKTKNTFLADKVSIADNPFSRIKGLLGRKGLASGEALLIRPCNSIHTVFMRFDIDCLFVDKNRRVVKAIPNIKPGRIIGPFLHSSLVIELPAGVIQSSLTCAGDVLSF